jgi:hypothetical protein
MTRRSSPTPLLILADDKTIFPSLQDKTEATIERYRSEKRRLVKACEILQAQLQLKDAEIARSKAAVDQLQGAITNFQRLGVS